MSSINQTLGMITLLKVTKVYLKDRKIFKIPTLKNCFTF